MEIGEGAQRTTGWWINFIFLLRWWFHGDSYIYIYIYIFIWIYIYICQSSLNCNLVAHQKHPKGVVRMVYRNVEAIRTCTVWRHFEKRTKLTKSQSDFYYLYALAILTMSMIKYTSIWKNFLLVKVLKNCCFCYWL